jgi:hypothetical protein
LNTIILAVSAERDPFGSALAGAGLKPHLVRTFKLSNDPNFAAKVVDVVGFFINLEGGFADEAIMTDALDVEQTSVGRKAELTQFQEIFDASADGEVAGVVDGVFGSKRLSLLVVLLDAGFL